MNGSDSGETTARSGVVRAQDAEVLLAGRLGAVLLAGEDATGGAAAFMVHPLAPQALGSPLHTHRHEDEWSYVLEGEVGVQIGDETWVTGPGDLVLKPRGVPHAFWNPGDVPARLLEVATPGGFERYFTRLAGVLAKGPEPDMAALAAVADDFGLEVDAASIPRLVEAHALRLG